MCSKLRILSAGKWFLFVMLTVGGLENPSRSQEKIIKASPSPVSPPPLQEFHQESEKDFKLRSFGDLEVTNAKGDISIQGWSLDKVRIKIRKAVFAESLESAKKSFQILDYRFSVEKNKIEVSTQYGKDLSIEERMREKENPKSKVDFLIFAPSHLKLKTWVVNGKTTLKSWNAPVEMRSSAGAIRVENTKTSHLSLRCTSCGAEIKETRGSIRAIVGDGQLSLSNIFAKSLYAESTGGLIKIWHVGGDQIYSSQSGAIEGQFIEGNVEFHNHSGGVSLKDLSGFASGTTESGHITITARKWIFEDKALIETIQGNVQITLPRPFSANVDLWSVHGKTQLDFPFESTADSSAFGPVPSSHLIGRVREGGDLFKIYSESGNIQVTKSD